jgi:uncharacterized protein with HEPN domain
MPKPDRIRLQHMLDTADKVPALVRGKVRADLDADETLVMALLRYLEIIGEAASAISQDTRRKLSGLPWATSSGCATA